MQTHVLSVLKKKEKEKKAAEATLDSAFFVAPA